MLHWRLSQECIVKIELCKLQNDTDFWIFKILMLCKHAFLYTYNFWFDFLIK